jgi:hypothetical protein
MTHEEIQELIRQALVAGEFLGHVSDRLRDQDPDLWQEERPTLITLVEEAKGVLGRVVLALRSELVEGEERVRHL